jgi:hypothetical protein
MEVEVDELDTDVVVEFILTDGVENYRLADTKGLMLHGEGWTVVEAKGGGDERRRAARSRRRVSR